MLGSILGEGAASGDTHSCLHFSGSILGEDAASGDAQLNAPVQQSMDIEALLGWGASANVYLGRRSRVHGYEEAPGKDQVILKVVRNHAELSPSDSALLEKEARAMAALQYHPNIVGFHGLYRVYKGIEDEGIILPCWAMQIEYCKGGDLHDRVSANRFVENEAIPVMRGIFAGLSHIHELGYIHRDIKPENILWADGNIKITDFGICCHTSNELEMQRKCGSAGYIAPEIILRQSYGPNADCFSAGALFYFILSGKLAFSGPNVTTTLRKTVHRTLDFRKSMRLECISESCKEFMLKLTSKDPLHRPTAADALQSLWLFESNSTLRASSHHEANLTSNKVPDVENSAHQTDDMLFYSRDLLQVSPERLPKSERGCTNFVLPPSYDSEVLSSSPSSEKEINEGRGIATGRRIVKMPCKPERPNGLRPQQWMPYFLRASRRKNRLTRDSNMQTLRSSSDAQIFSDACSVVSFDT